MLSLTTGLFRDVCREVGAQYPSVTVDDEHVDAMAAHLVRHGGDYDVVVTENMFGDILSDLAGELSGSLGTAASINASDTQAMAQAAHGAAPDIAGRNRANPTALILSAAMLLDRLGTVHDLPDFVAAARRIEHAVEATVEAGVATADLGGTRFHRGIHRDRGRPHAASLSSQLESWLSSQLLTSSRLEVLAWPP